MDAAPPSKRECSRHLGQQSKVAVVLASSLVLVVGWRLLGSTDFYTHHLHKLFALPVDADVAGAVYYFGSCLLLLGVVPALLVKLILREKLADYGVHLGIRRRTVRSFLICAPGVVLLGYLASSNLSLRAVFPLNPRAGEMFGFHAVTYLCFYVGWEFHFRGFVQHGIREALGDQRAILVQTAASSLAHLGSPGIEVFGAAVGGVVWGWLAFRTRSLLSGLLQHFLLGLAVDFSVCFLTRAS